VPTSNLKQCTVPSLGSSLVSSSKYWGKTIGKEMVSEIDEWHYLLNGFSIEEITFTQLHYKQKELVKEMPDIRISNGNVINVNKR
jgi:hypothetical protein